MRIRTDGDYGHREDFIDSASEYYGCNKTQAVLNACDDVTSIVAATARVLSRDDLTQQQREEMAAEFNEARGVEFDVEPATVDVTKGDE